MPDQGDCKHAPSHNHDRQVIAAVPVSGLSLHTPSGRLFPERAFVTSETCYLIVRHIGLGSNIANFLIDNGPDSSIERSSLYPKTVKDLAHHLAFLEHDLILYNFVWDYHQAQRDHLQCLPAVQARGLNFDSIQPGGREY
jgi:hypothetical protein